MQNPLPPTLVTLDLPDEAATGRLAARIANALKTGDLVTLSGDLGVGKTTFARALIRLLLNDPDAEIPSPTYTLLQSYEGPQGRVIHADLYRIHDPSELAELGWEESAEDAILLVEWAEKAGETLAEDRLDIRFSMVPGHPQARQAHLSGFGGFAARLKRAAAIQSVLDGAGFSEARRVFMQGDASARSYEQVINPDGRKAILMIAPKRPDGPPIRLGKPYSSIAKLATSVDAFVAIGNGLRNLGYSAPAILGADLATGLLLVEDLGREGVIDETGPLEARYALAIDMLADLHARRLPTELPVLGEGMYSIPRFDLEAMGIETELLLDWYFPYAVKRTPSAGTRLGFIDHWASALEPVMAGEKTWVLRDYHSPNLIFIENRSGLQAMGIIDFQDCVYGHPAYDVVSLLQDARVSVPEAMEVALLARYVRQRRLHDPDFNLGDFTRAYATLGAQRATKILGIFVRLDRRDGKPAYLKHLGRIEAYLKRCLQHPALAKLSHWYCANLPGFAPNLETEGAIEHAQDADQPNQSSARDNPASQNPTGQNRASDGAGGGAGDADAPLDQHATEAVDPRERDEPAGL